MTRSFETTFFFTFYLLYYSTKSKRIILFGECYVFSGWGGRRTLPPTDHIILKTVTIEAASTRYVPSSIQGIFEITNRVITFSFESDALW